MPGRSAHLTAAETRACAELVGQVGAAVARPTSPEPNVGDRWQNVLLNGLRELTGSRAVLMFVLGHTRGDAEPSVLRVDRAGLDDPAELAALYAYTRDGAATDPFMARFIRHRGPLIVSDRRDLVDNSEWYNCKHYCEYRRAGRVDHCAYSLVRWETRPPFRALSVGMHREPGDRPFGPRQRMILETTQRALGGWYATLVPPAVNDPAHRSSTMCLPARQRQVLASMLRGKSEHAIAEELGISKDTVHYHIRMVYRRMAVTSRSELLSKFISEPLPAGNSRLA